MAEDGVSATQPAGAVNLRAEPEPRGGLIAAEPAPSRLSSEHAASIQTEAITSTDRKSISIPPKKMVTGYSFPNFSERIMLTPFVCENWEKSSLSPFFTLRC
jgi:hypothetical protein